MRSEVERTIDPVGRTSYFSYDRLGRKTHESNALSESTYMGYDSRSNEVLRALPPEGGFTGLVWLDSFEDEIWTSSFDGTGAGDLRSAGTTVDVRAVGVDLTHWPGWVYWTRSGRILRARIDGTDAEEAIVTTGFTYSYDLCVVPELGKLYFSDEVGATKQLRSANLDGSGVQDIGTGTLYSDAGVAVDPDSEEVYLVQSGDIVKANLDGTGLTTFLSTTTAPLGLALDLRGRQLYYVESGSSGEVRRISLDGTGDDQFAGSLAYPERLALDPVGERVFWTERDPADDRIRSKATAGGSISTVYTGGSNTLLTGVAAAFAPKATRWAYDRLGRQSTREDALRGVQYFGYDAVGNRVLTLDELENPTYFGFDGLRRTTRVTDALQKHTYFEFDERSLQVKRISANAGETTYMAHDGAGRLETEWFTTDSPLYFTYDQVSNLTEVKNNLGGTDSEFVFDKLDRLEKKWTVGGAVYYAYDASGMKTSLKDPGLKESVYVYDSVGRLEKLQLDGADTTYFAYDASNMVEKRVFPGGFGSGKVMAYYSWDDAGRLEQLENKGPTASDLLSYFHYTRNAVGRPVRTQLAGGSANVYYVYDALDRVTQDLKDVGIVVAHHNEFEYDAASNRTLKIDQKASEHSYYEYNAANLLEQEWNKDTATTAYFEFDHAQRMISKKVVGGQSSYFEFDQRAQVTSVDFRKTGGGADDRRRFVYTGTGERSKILVGEIISDQFFLAYDGDKLISEDEVLGNVRRYRHNSTGLPELGSKVRTEGADGKGSSALDGCGSDSYLMKDGGEPIEADTLATNWDAWGNQTGQTGTFLEGQRLGFIPGLFVGLNTSEDMLLDGSGLYLPGIGLGVATMAGVIFAASVGGTQERGPGGRTEERTGRGTQGQPPGPNWGAGLDDLTIEIGNTCSVSAAFARIQPTSFKSFGAGGYVFKVGFVFAAQARSDCEYRQLIRNTIRLWVPGTPVELSGAEVREKQAQRARDFTEARYREAVERDVRGALARGRFSAKQRRQIRKASEKQRGEEMRRALEERRQFTTAINTGRFVPDPGLSWQPLDKGSDNQAGGGIPGRTPSGQQVVGKATVKRDMILEVRSKTTMTTVFKHPWGFRWRNTPGSPWSGTLGTTSVFWGVYGIDDQSRLSLEQGG